ncbi:MAG TPA: helix-turn-helix domain-containing protein [Thermoleophilia bacterium]|nr:helix-turn-helix domain-containing protein [Thermoleophilia bacterium]
MSARKPSADGRVAQAASRTLDVLEFFECQSVPVSASGIASACGIPRSSLYTLLRMLRGRGYVSYSRADRGWICGRRLLDRKADGFRFADGMAVVEVVAAGGGGLTAAEVAARSGLPGDTVGAVLTALEGEDLVLPGYDGTFAVGRRLVALESPFGWTERLQSIARPILVHLRDASGETASLVVQDGDDALYLDQVESFYELRCGGWAGRRVSRTGTSAGEAFADVSRAHVVADAVEAGVTAITCAAAGIIPPVGVNVIGPTWRVEERGIEELADLVQVAAGKLAAAYVATRSLSA